MLKGVVNNFFLKLNITTYKKMTYVFFKLKYLVSNWNKYKELEGILQVHLKFAVALILVFRFFFVLVLFFSAVFVSVGTIPCFFIFRHLLQAFQYLLRFEGDEDCKNCKSLNDYLRCFDLKNGTNCFACKTMQDVFNCTGFNIEWLKFYKFFR